MPLLACTVEPDLTIDHNRHELVLLCVFELDDSMTIPRKLSPPARFLCVLFDSLVFATSDPKCNCLQALAARTAHRYRLALHIR